MENITAQLEKNFVTAETTNLFLFLYIAGGKDWIFKSFITAQVETSLLSTSDQPFLFPTVYSEKKRLRH